MNGQEGKYKKTAIGKIQNFSQIYNVRMQEPNPNRQQQRDFDKIEVKILFNEILKFYFAQFFQN